MGIRPVAQIVFRRLLRLRYGVDGLVRAKQNGRVWWLEQSVALRGEDAEYSTVEWLRKNIKAGQTVIDVGANVGQMTLEMALLVGENGNVIAIEPGPGNLVLLKRHIEANRFGKFTEIIEAACGNVHGKSVEFKILGNDPDAIGSGFHLAGLREEGQWITVSVPMVTIDEVCKSRKIAPSVIKIDVEGAELQVLEGAKMTLRTAKPAVRFGFHPFAFDEPTQATARIRALLHEVGYRMCDEVSQCLELAEYDAWFCE